MSLSLCIGSAFCWWYTECHCFLKYIFRGLSFDPFFPGSALLRERREKRERGKMRHRFWELGGSRMGEAMGIKEEGVDGEGQVVKKEEDDVNYDYKAESKFSDHLKNLKHEVSTTWEEVSSTLWSRNHHSTRYAYIVSRHGVTLHRTKPSKSSESIYLSSRYGMSL